MQTISRFLPSGSTFMIVPWCFTLAGKAWARGFGKDEISLVVTVEVKRELVEMMCDVEVVVEIFVEVGLAVAIEVV